jgi:hypothetical protein
MTNKKSTAEALAPMHICQCGCGQPIPDRPNHRWKPPRFLRGHAMRSADVKARWAERRSSHPVRPDGAPIHLCRCGCGETIPWRPSHRTRPPRFIQAHYLRDGTSLRIEKLREAKRRVRANPPADWTEPTGVCACGCGHQTRVATFSRPEKGEFIGFPRRFCPGHHMRGRVGPASNRFGTGRHVDGSGYVKVLVDGRYLPEHRLIYERTHGVTLPPHVHVHHINGDRKDNRPGNLIATTRERHIRTHVRAGEWVSLLLDEHLYAAARQYLSEHGHAPDLEALASALHYD